MSRRLSGTLLILLGAAVLIFQFALKEFPTKSDVRDEAQRQDKMREWLGKNAPDFEVKLTDGSMFRLADVVGKKIILINFFATWCGPCRGEMPELKRFAARRKDQGFLLLFVDAMDTEKDLKTVRNFASAQLPDFAVGLDADGAVCKAYRVDAFPTSVLIDSQGRVREYHVGALGNADVVFQEPVRSGLQAIKKGWATSREDYLARLELHQIHKSPPEGLTGAALAFAQRLRCPACGKTLVKCRDVTGTKIKDRLRSMNLEHMSDEAVLKALFLEEARP